MEKKAQIAKVKSKIVKEPPKIITKIVDRKLVPIEQIG